jgi:hypothetical protein
MTFVAVIIQVIIMYKLPMFITRKDVEFAITVTTSVWNPSYDNCQGCSPNKRPRPRTWCDRSRQHKWTPMHNDFSYRLHRPLMPTRRDVPSHTQFVELIRHLARHWHRLVILIGCNTKSQLTIFTKTTCKGGKTSIFYP